MKRLALAAAALVALAAPANAGAALFVLFDRPSAAPNDRMTVRTGHTPKDFILSRGVKPFQRAVRIYLVRNDVAARVRSRLDSRLNFVGSITPDKNGRGLLTFSVPPLDTVDRTRFGGQRLVRRPVALPLLSFSRSQPATGSRAWSGV